MKRRSVLLAGLSLASLLACSAETETARPRRVRPLVCTTIHPTQFFVQQLAGDLVDTEMLLPAATDPRHWVPSRPQLQRLLDADLVIFHGATLEPWHDKLALPRRRRTVVCTGFDPHYLRIKGSLTHTHGGKSHTHDGIDPFLWLDFDLAARQAEVVARALGRLLPGQAPAINQRLAALRQKLRDALKTQAASLQGIQRVYQTSRVFDYWARRHQIQIHNLDLDTAPSPERLAELRRMIAGSSQRLVLCPTEPSPQLAATLTSLGLQAVLFEPCFTAPPGTDLFSIMAQNHQRLTR